jgi:hypothetical protein
MRGTTPDQRIDSAKTAIRAILPLAILERHKDEVLSLLIWKITEAGGKYTLRYRSRGSIENQSSKKQHEHVYPRKWLISQLKAKPDQLDQILERAIGCLVTIQEHRAVSAVDSNLLGWDRYKAAGVDVFDTRENRWIVSAGM